MLENLKKINTKQNRPSSEGNQAKSLAQSW
jgi:hypothetical protein